MTIDRGKFRAGKTDGNLMFGGCKFRPIPEPTTLVYKRTDVSDTRVDRNLISVFNLGTRTVTGRNNSLGPPQKVLSKFYFYRVFLKYTLSMAYKTQLFALVVTLCAVAFM